MPGPQEGSGHAQVLMALGGSGGTMGQELVMPCWEQRPITAAGTESCGFIVKWQSGRTKWCWWRWPGAAASRPRELGPREGDGAPAWTQVSTKISSVEHAAYSCGLGNAAQGEADEINKPRAPNETPTWEMLCVLRGQPAHCRHSREPCARSWMQTLQPAGGRLTCAGGTQPRGGLALVGAGDILGVAAGGG